MTDTPEDMEDLQVTYPGAGTFKFGDSAKLSARLLERVRAGQKRAMSGALAEFDDDPDSMPKVGRCDIAANWDGTPALVIRTVKVEQVRFCDVTEELAQAEGESLEGWQRGHKAQFERQGLFDPEMMLLFEHFELVEDLANR